MSYYRLYFMDRFSGHIDHFREFEAEDDAVALGIADGWREDRPMERAHAETLHPPGVGAQRFG